MNYFKVLKSYDINWLKNNSASGGAQQIVINSKPCQNIAICSQSHKLGRIYADVTKEELLYLTSSYDIGLTEIISQYPYKVYFDIDKTDLETIDKKNYMQSLINKINEIFDNSDMAISGSETENYKLSYHIILNNYMINNHEERDKLKNIVSYLKNNFDNGFDDVVYKNNQQMKMIKQSKMINKDQIKRVQNIILNNDSKKHIITTFFNENVKNINDVILNDDIKQELIMIENKKALNLGSLPKIKINKIQHKQVNHDILLNDVVNNEYLLNLAPLDANFNHSYTFFVMLFAYSNNVSLNSFLNWYKQKSDNETKINNKIIVWNTLNKYKQITTDTFKNMLSIYYPSLKTSKNVLKFDRLFDISKYNDQINIIETIEPKNFINESKYLIFNIGMGGGKTAQTIDYLKLNKDLKFLFISPNQALSYSVYDRMKKASNKIDVEHYDIEYANIETTKRKQKSKMSNAKNLIICINSLHYLDTNNYDVIICDEIETLNNKFFDNKTMKNQIDRSLLSWAKYIDLMQKAKKVILLDAFITNQTISFISNIINPNEKLTIYKRLVEKSNREFNILPNLNNLVNGIISKLNKNKKVYIYYPFKTGNKLNSSMQQLKEIIELKTNKKGKIYNADIDDKYINELKDVNKHWVTSDFIITNSKITVGVNFDVENYFDCCFISLASFSSPRDVIQASCRSRSIISNKVYVCFIDQVNLNNTFDPSAYLLRDDKIYNELVADVITEKTAPLKSSFYTFCKKAGYKVILNKYECEAANDIDDLLKEESLTYTFDTIDNITSSQADEIQTNIINHIATGNEKIKLRKYFFIKKFNVVNENDMYNISKAWDKRFNFFFESLEYLSYDKNNIFEQIKMHNNWESYFPTDKQIDNVKLNETIINNIFVDENKWWFLRLKQTSGAKTIIKTMYNNIFKMNVITGVTIKSHTKFKISSKYHEMLSFGLTNLKAYVKKTNIINDFNIISLLDKDIFSDDN